MQFIKFDYIPFKKTEPDQNYFEVDVVQKYCSVFWVINMYYIMSN